METMFVVKNMVLNAATRMDRARGAGQQRSNVFIGGGAFRVPRGRSATITETLLRRYLPEIKSKCAMGMLVVTDNVGRTVDLDSLVAVVSMPATVPIPKPLLDSAARDKHGHTISYKPELPGGKHKTAVLAVPSLVKRAKAEVEAGSGSDEEDATITS